MKRILLLGLAILAICFASMGCTGEQGIQGERGDPGGQGPQVATGYGESDIPVDWNGTAFVIDPDNLPRLLGSGFSPGETVKVYLVVAPTTSVLMATLTTNSIGCFYADLAELNGDGGGILVQPDASLDRTRSNGDSFRECYFQAEVDGEQVTIWPVVLIGKRQSKLESANAELVAIQAAIEACLVEANAANYDAAVTGWTGNLAGSPSCTVGQEKYTVYGMMATHDFRAAYDINVAGEVTYGNPNIVGGWGSEIEWNPTTRQWEEAS